MLQPKQRLGLAHDILNSDCAFESSSVECDLAQGRDVTDREKAMSKALNHLYRLIHPAFKCKHPDWEKQNEKDYESK